MIRIQNKEDCCGCTACSSVCPKKCIKMVVDAEGYYYPQVETEHCIDCHLCEKVCPLLNEIDFDGYTTKAYAVQHIDDKIRKDSASGGAFTAFAVKILELGGIVYGGAFDEEFHVRHIRIEQLNDLWKLRGSKYVQSDMKDNYNLVKNDLKNGKLVLFSGTPCQVAGLVKSLRGLYPTDKLFLVDLVCHGIPSPHLWNIFVGKLKKKYGNLLYASFRNKHFGYAGSTMAMKFEHGKMRYLERDVQFYKKLFFDDINSRPSCFQCHFKTIKRISDFTIFDCWHVNKVSADMDDDKGATWVFIQSAKGEEFFESIKPMVKSVEASVEKAVELDGKLAVSCPKPNPRRAEFFEDAQKLEFNELLEKYFPMTWKKRLVNMVKPIFARVGFIKVLKRL